MSCAAAPPHARAAAAWQAHAAEQAAQVDAGFRGSAAAAALFSCHRRRVRHSSRHARLSSVAGGRDEARTLFRRERVTAGTFSHPPAAGSHEQRMSAQMPLRPPLMPPEESRRNHTAANRILRHGRWRRKVIAQRTYIRLAYARQVRGRQQAHPCPSRSTINAGGG